ncbi:NUDIX hydrolase [Leptolyngbya sp. AN02str]|uniref:NUDIX hydrolase n=1 Tax=Leptolyngbya sp. AN02str TaxID=3423363 RepID=UPI003D31FF9F
MSSADTPSIRVLALGFVIHGDRTLVAEVQDIVKNERCYRSLGGGVEFGETSLEALHREFAEEIRAELTDVHYLGCVENLFHYNGKPYHEVIQVYRCCLADPTLYELPLIAGVDSTGPFVAHWIECDRFRTQELRLVPEACLQWL